MVYQKHPEKAWRLVRNLVPVSLSLFDECTLKSEMLTGVQLDESKGSLCVILDESESILKERI